MTQIGSVRARSFRLVGVVVIVLLVLGSPTLVRADLAPVATLWGAGFPGPANDIARSAIALSPSGDSVFVAGWSESDPQGLVTAAYDAKTGSQMWSTSDGVDIRPQSAITIVVTPSGDRVYVSRGSGQSISGYDAATGQLVFSSSGHGHDLELSPDGSVLYVLGTEVVEASWDFLTQAISTETGILRWSRTYDGPDNDEDMDFAADLTVAPDGNRVYITGSAWHPLPNNGGSTLDYVTLAYDAATGDDLWSALHQGDSHDWAVAIDASATHVLVTGWSERYMHYTTLAYDALTGSERWLHTYGALVETYQGLSVWGGPYQPVDLELSPSGDTVYVAGSAGEFVTVAIDAAKGNQRWAARYDGHSPFWLNGGHYARELAVSQDGSRVYVSGSGYSKNNGLTSLNYASVGYDAPSGVEVWSATYDGPGNGNWHGLPFSGHDYLHGMALSPDSSRVYVTGESWFGHPRGKSTDAEYRTIAYCTLEAITDCLEGS